MITFLKNSSYLRPTTWVESQSWAINKTVVQTNRTLLTAHLLEPFKLHARIDGTYEDDMCRMILAAAIAAVEHHTGLTINPTERLWGVRGWTYPNVLQIQSQPVQTLLVTDSAGVDISALCEINSNVDDVMFYLRVPSEYTDFDVAFGTGFYADPANVSLWTIANMWSLLNAWSVPDAVIDEHAMLRHAILVTAGDFYENRQSDTSQPRTAIPSIAEMLLRPIRRPVEF